LLYLVSYMLDCVTCILCVA